MTENSNYQPTFMEKLLGKHYKWYFLIIYNIKMVGANLTANLFQIVVRIMETVTTSYVWYFAKADSSVFTYLLVGRIYKALGENGFYGNLSSQIISGKITSDLMRPQPIMAYFSLK